MSKCTVVCILDVKLKVFSVRNNLLGTQKVITFQVFNNLQL